MSDTFQLLIQGFEFDLWANKRWLAYLDGKSELVQDQAIFAHIFSGQEVWRQRVLGSPPTEMPRFEVSERAIIELSEGWRELLRSRTDNPIIHYHRFDGEPGHLHLDQIARHLIDHGTYHRGELRGLCRSRNDEDFPETGLGLYYMSQK